MNKTIYDFGKEMNKQLAKHSDEKIDIKKFDLTGTWSNTVTELDDRIKILKNNGPEEMKKQCVHMANYLFFLWRKLNED